MHTACVKKKSFVGDGAHRESQHEVDIYKEEVNINIE